MAEIIHTHVVHYQKEYGLENGSDELALKAMEICFKCLEGNTVDF